MRTSLVSSLCFGLACAGLAISVDACGGATNGSFEAVPDGGLPDVRVVEVIPPDAADARPDAPPVPGQLSLFGTYAVQRLFLGETNRAGMPMKDAWKQYGENIDGLVSTKIPNGECTLQGGADSAKREDGLGGIDNAFGRTILGFILGLTPTPSKTANDEIAVGGRTMMFSLLPESGVTPSRVGFLLAGSTTPPAWNGTDVRAAAASTVGVGPEDPLCLSTTPRSTGLVVSSGIATGTFYLEVPMQGEAWRIPIRHARVTMTLSADGQYATNGVIAGVASTEDLVAGIEKVAGRISTQLCSGSTLDTIKQTIRQASDILVDGSQDPTKQCDAVSIGIGFDAVKVTAAGVQADPKPLPDPCL